MTASWSGHRVTKARLEMATLLPAPCAQCGNLIHPDPPGTIGWRSGWVIGHKEPRGSRPDLIWDRRNWQLEHRRCSNRTGQAGVIAKAKAQALAAAGVADRSSGRAPRPRIAAPARISLSVTADTPTVGSEWGKVAHSMPWLKPVSKVPADATPPRYVTSRHPATTGSYGAEFCAWADAHPEMHPRRTEGLRWWQRMVAFRLLEHDAGGRLVWRNALVTLSRQGGKSWLLRALMLWRIQQRDRFGGEEQTVIHVAHRMPTATEVWRPAARWAVGGGWRVRWANGEQLIESLDGGRWLIRAATDGVGVGFSLSSLVVDEGWMIPRSVVEAADPALTESESPQLLLVSTAGDSASDLFGSYRDQALATLLEPVNTLLVEWSAPPDAEMDDRAGWRAASPFWSARRESEILDKLAKLAPLEFRQNCLNQWVDHAHGRRDPGVPVFARAEWEGLGSYVAGAPQVAALEAYFAEGAAVALAENLGDKVGVSVRLFTSVAAAGAWLSAVWPSVPVLVGKSLMGEPALSELDCRPVGGMTWQAVRDLRRLVDEQVLVHDGGTDLGEQVLAARTVPSSDGPRMRSTGRCDGLKAAAWAAVHARAVVEVPAIF